MKETTQASLQSGAASGPVDRPSARTATWRFRLPKHQIGYVRFIVESYEGLAQVSSEPGRGEMLWIVPIECEGAARELAASLSLEVGLRQV